MLQQSTNDSSILPDTQNKSESTGISINKVGIKDIKMPFTFTDGEQVQKTTGNFSMYCFLEAGVKGTHMSRFIEILNTNVEISFNDLDNLLVILLEKMESNEVFIEVNFDFFINKTAPISGLKSLMDYNVTLCGSVKKTSKGHKFDKKMSVTVPVTSLCPCSKSISKYGAHNQRSHITIDFKTDKLESIAKIIAGVEQRASCDLYGVLKRIDEKYVTERAYENPAFVEDLVRSIALFISKDFDMSYYKVQSENFESIHNHSAYAMIEK